MTAKPALLSALTLSLAGLLAGGCDVESNLSTGMGWEQQPKTLFAQSPTTLPTNPSLPSPATPGLDSPTTAPAEDPAAGGSSHSPRSLDVPYNTITTNVMAARASANPDKPNATKPIPQ